MHAGKVGQIELYFDANRVTPCETSAKEMHLNDINWLSFLIILLHNAAAEPMENCLVILDHFPQCQKNASSVQLPQCLALQQTPTLLIFRVTRSSCKLLHPRDMTCQMWFFTCKYAVLKCLQKFCLALEFEIGLCFSPKAFIASFSTSWADPRAES